MKSRRIKKNLFLTINALLGVALAGAVSAQSGDDRRIDLQNVDPETGEISLGQITSIPIDPDVQLKILEDGSIQADCLGDTDGKCPGIGISGGSGSGAFPTLEFTAPATGVTIPDSNQTAKMTWNTSSAVECYGLSSNPLVSSWDGTRFTSAQKEFTVGSLPRGATERTYTFSLGCYSKAISASNVEEAGYVKKTHTVKLAATETGGGGTDPTTSCAAYRDTVHPGATLPPKSQKGFLAQPGAVLTEVPFDFGTAFGSSFYSLMAGTWTGGEGYLPGEQAGQGKYLSIPLVVPDGASFINKGMVVSWFDPQGQGLSPGKIDFNISPCPGDFRQPTFASDNDPWLRPTCRRTDSISTTLNLTTGSASGNTGNFCKLVRGTTMYMNITLHDTSVLGNPGNPVPPYRCGDGYTCAVRMPVSPLTTTF